MNKEMTVNGKSYTIIKLLGKGKGGYSYLAESGNNRYVLKQIHHEPCDYYQFGKDVYKRQEQGVYTFLQGPKSWAERRAWSGEWSNQYVRGNYFGNFGCGLCCMANIYCTLTEHTCSPWDMYEYARQVSGYAPSRKIGACLLYTSGRYSRLQSLRSC